MDKPEIIKAYCELSGTVAAKVFAWDHAADCFCTPQAEGWNFQYEAAVLDYIKAAVAEKMEREGHNG